MTTGDRIQREIRKRAFDRRELLEQQTADAQHTQYTLDALAQVTGLSRLELERIAGEVTASFAADHDDFFSIKHQLILSGAAFVPILAITWLLVLWIR
jgi:AraC-like DNA-binding protein